MSIDNTTVREIKRELSGDGVWVSPDLRSEISKADERRIEQAVDATKTNDVYVVMVEVPYEDPTFHGDPDALFATLHDETGLDGTYIGIDGQQEPGVTAKAFASDGEPMYAAWVAQERHADDLTAQVVDTVELIEADNAQQLYNEMEQRPGQTSADDSGLSTGLIIGLVVAVIIVVGVGLVARRRAKGTSKDGFAPPVNVLTTVRAAERRRLLKRAKHDLLTLGERIDTATMNGASDAWQAALDHYDKSRRLLDDSPSPADVVGAIVLIERGSTALDAALADRDWTPATPCYFNPLHGPAGGTARWGSEQGAVDVPACEACADAVEAGRTPDALDFLEDGVPQHYFKLALEPWSSTGYGALDTDLLAHMQ